MSCRSRRRYSRLPPLTLLENTLTGAPPGLTVIEPMPSGTPTLTTLVPVSERKPLSFSGTPSKVMPISFMRKPRTNRLVAEMSRPRPSVAV
ncbi:hypothetical protein D3C72_2393730 [compost metagenome]